MEQEISVNRPRLAAHYPPEPRPCQSAGTVAVQLGTAACWEPPFGKSVPIRFTSVTHRLSRLTCISPQPGLVSSLV